MLHVKIELVAYEEGATMPSKSEILKILVASFSVGTASVGLAQSTGIKNASVGIQFVQGGLALTPSQVAGAVPQGNFNPVAVANSTGTSGTTNFLLDTNGNATGITLTHVSNDGFSTHTDTTTPDGILLNGEDKTGPAGQNSVVDPGDSATYTFNNVPSGSYNLIAYIESDADIQNRNGVIVNANLSVGATTYYVADQAVAGGTPAFSLANNTDPNTRITGNYVEFNNVTPSNGKITLTNTEEGGAYNTAAINGMQLLPIGTLSSPDLPIPTKAPAISAFPSQTALYGSNLKSFIQQHASDFSGPSQQVLAANASAPQIQGDTFWKDVSTGTGNTLIGLSDTVNIGLAALDSPADASLDIAINLLPAKYQNFATGLSASGDLALNFAAKKNPTVALIALNSFIYGKLVAPSLLTLGQDPYDPNYKQAVSPAAFSPIEIAGSPLQNALINEYNAEGQASVYLDAVNTAYNRYCTALDQSDSQSAGLQLESILSNFTLYRSEMADGSVDLGIVNSLLPSSGLQMNYGPAGLADLQQQIEQNGLPADTAAFLESLGLDQADIDQVTQNILALDPNSYSGNIGNDLSAIQSNITESVPEPTSLAIIGIFSVILLMRRNRKLNGPLAVM